VPLTMLTPPAIQGYFTRKLLGVKNDQGKWFERPLSSTTVRHHAMLLHKALQTAVRQGVLVQNPADRVDLPRNSEVKPQVLDEEQTRVFLGEARRSSQHYRFYLAALTTGMRAGELMGLRWKDVDLATGTASVQQTFYRLGRQLLFGKPKSEKSRRIVVLPPILVEELRRLREEQTEARGKLGAVYENLDLVF